jgi:uncharacterized membrane protein
MTRIADSAQLVPTKRLTDWEATYSARSSVTIRKPVAEVYEYWRDLGRLPSFMVHLQSVEVREDGTSHWVASGPAGRTVSWDAEVVADLPGHSIAWQSRPGSGIRNRGRVEFSPAPADQGTEVRVHLEFSSPANAVGNLFARILGEHPSIQVADDLRRFKQVMETGEVMRSDAAPAGPRTVNLATQRPAVPPEPRPTPAELDRVAL